MAIRPKPLGVLGQQFLDTNRVALPAERGGSERYGELHREFARLVMGGTADETERFMTQAAADNADLMQSDSFGMNSYAAAIRYQKRLAALAFQRAIGEVSTAGNRPEVIRANEQRLRHNTIDVSTDNIDHGLATALFPSGNWLQHGTSATGIVGILRDGKIRSTADFVASSRDGFKKSQGGAMGISWNFNNVGALVGDSRHLAGFMADPSVLLTEQGGMLAVPQKSSFGELQYYKAEPEEIDHLRNVEFQDNSSFWLGMIMQGLASYRDGSLTGPSAQAANAHLVAEGIEILKGHLAANLDADYLRRFYRIDRNNTVHLLPHMSQEDRKYLSMPVLLQAARDGAFGPELEQMLANGMPQELTPHAIRTILRVHQAYDAAAGRMLADVGKTVGIASAVQVANTIFYCSSKDYEKWLPVLAASRHQPRGIVVYDAREVREPSNFVIPFPNEDKAKLTEQLRRLNGSDAMDWSTMFAEEPQRARHHKYLINYQQTSLGGVLVAENGRLQPIDYDDID